MPNNRTKIRSTQAPPVLHVSLFRPFILQFRRRPSFPVCSIRTDGGKNVKDNYFPFLSDEAKPKSDMQWAKLCTCDVVFFFFWRGFGCSQDGAYLCKNEHKLLKDISTKLDNL